MNLENFIEAFITELTERVVKRLQESAAGDEMIDALAKAVIQKMGDDTTNAYNFLKVKIKGENIIDLRPEHIEDLETFVEDCIGNSSSQINDIATEAAEEALKNASFEVTVS